MRKIVTIAGAIVLVIAVVAVCLAGFAWFGSQHKRNRIVDVNVAPVAIAVDPEGIARGKYLYESRGCTDCHGRDGAGKVVIDDGAGMLVRAPNISSAVGTVANALGPLDWVRLLRHGIKPNGRPVLIMPSEDYARMTDEDLGMLVGYVKTLPPVEGQVAEIKLPLVVRFLYASGIIRDAAEKIDHTLPPPQPIAPTATIAYGDYVANSCRGCHNPALSGGPIPGAPPDWPAAANLTTGAGSAMAHYPSEAAFAAMLKSGKRPDGSPVSPVMPFESLKELDASDVAALYAFFKSLPAKKQGEV
ncbi:Cytochrome C oxidase, cbb3-type, subunit III [Kaistia soli DSM 19436]|uniref:Cytochrome C oxidase, cbb3-type, subunit III n=1 Tax=Kaistia soli DSM 19436 TaxID=1122133 RepID=A0A1M4U861_9HYPH|nr:c-type cytochrome [Kaistia soli]SHE52787.1 Cytochrome C oxidase, cbb3-type, subunit III [Kaistia soli DSM 19436]